MKALWPLILASILCATPVLAQDYQIKIKTSFVANPKIYGAYKSRTTSMQMRGRQVAWQMPGSLVLNKQKLVFLQLPLNGKMAATSLQFKRQGKGQWLIPVVGQEKSLATIYLPYIKKAMQKNGPKNWQRLPNEIIIKDVFCQTIARSVACTTVATVKVFAPPAPARKVVQSRPHPKAAQS